MGNFNAKDIVMQRALSQNIIDELKLVLQKINDSALKIAENYNSLYAQMINAKSLLDAEKLSNQLDIVKEKLISLFAVGDRIETLINRNKVRVNFLDLKINSEKITKIDINKKQMLAKIEEEKIELNDDKLNLNLDKSMATPIYCIEHILFIKNGKLSLEEEFNYFVLKDIKDKDFKTIVDKFPEVLMTITDSQLTDTKFKEKILKQLITIIDDRLKKLPMEKINKFFGNPLNFSKQEVGNYYEFIDEIKNLLQVRVKQYLRKIYPILESEINLRLKCDETSPYLPLKYQVKVQDDENNELLDDETNDEIEDTSFETEDEFNDFLNELLGDNND